MGKYSRRELIAGGAAASLLTRVKPASAHQAASAPRSKIRLGLVTYNVAKDWSFDTILKNCLAAGLEGAEFRTTHAHGVEPSLDSAARKDIKLKCLDSGLKQVSLGTTCEFHSPDPVVVRHNIDSCRQFTELARDIGALGVKVRPNGLPKDVPAEHTMDQIGKALRACGEFAASNGVEVWMEVHGSGTSLPANSRRIMDACGHPAAGLTWNSNATDLMNGSVKEGFRLLRPFIKCCHINDLWGEYPYRELFSLLTESGYDRFTLIECGFPIIPADGVPFLKCYRALWKELSQ